jgi:diguanylate cyclase
MSGDIETRLRGPGAYAVAGKALESMEQHQVWPTPVNYELWTHYVADPDGALGREITRLISVGEAFTDNLADELAATYLPKARLNEQIRDAGDALTKELAAVSRAIGSAQKSSEAYGQTLASASKSLVEVDQPADLKAMVDTLATATRRVQRENKSLEKRLTESTTEVTKLREHLEQVRRDATTDGLTQLANRKAVDEELERACSEADAGGHSLTLAVIDIDHFKNFNDTWGHQTGDQVIRYVASVIGRVGAPPRFAARYGGEEFALIFPRESAAMAAEVLEEIREEVSSRMLKRRSTNDDLGAITVSAGLAEMRQGESAHSLMERSDGALYVSKRTGRNRVTNAERVANAA